MSIAVKVLFVERFPDSGSHGPGSGGGQDGSTLLVPPANLQIDPSINSIQLTWDASLSTGVTGYRLWRRAGGVEVYVGDVLVSSSSYTFGGLLPETTYHLIVASLRGSIPSVQRSQITGTTLAASVPQSTIRFEGLEHNAIEDSTVEVWLKRRNGNNAAAEVVGITETPGATGSGTTDPDPPTGGGVDYTITWPGEVANEVEYLAGEDRAKITVYIEPDVIPDPGEYISFGIAPSASDAYLVDAQASTAVVNILDATVSTYADSVLTYTAIPGATATHIRAVVDIEPTHPASLPVLVLEDTFGNVTTADVFENTRLHHDTVDTVVVVGRVEHPVLADGENHGQTVILREDPAALPPGTDQFDNVNLSTMRYELRGVPTHGTITVDPFAVTLNGRLGGRYGKEALSYGYAEPPARSERIGFKTCLTWVGDVDMVMVKVMVENNLHDPTSAGPYVAHAESAGDVYFEALGIDPATLPAGYAVGHYHHNETSMVGDDFIANEGGFQVVPAKCRSNVKRFYIYKTSTYTQAQAEAKFAGAGLGQITGGPLMPSKHFGAMSFGAPAGIWPDHDQILDEMNREWAEMLARIKSGEDNPAWLWGSARWGHYHAGGPRYYTSGGGMYLFGVIGFSNTVAELNLVRHFCYMSQGRAATGINDSTNGSIVTPAALAAENSGMAPGVMAVNGSNFETWFRHMRPDFNTVHGSGAINPNITLHNSSGINVPSLMPLTNPWSIPGPGTMISNVDMFPFQMNSGSYAEVAGDPPQGSHHKRHTIFLEGCVRMEGGLLERWLAGEEASHVMHSHTQFPQDPLGRGASWGYHDLEWPMVEGIDDIENHAKGRPFHCQNGGGGGVNPAYIQRLSGEVQAAVALGLACSRDRDFRAEIQGWCGMYIHLADLRCSPTGWGARAFSPSDTQTSPNAIIGGGGNSSWGVPDLVNRRGGWPDWMIGQQAFWQMLASEGFAAVERRARPRQDFPSGLEAPHERMILRTLKEQLDRATTRGRKVPSSYGIVVGNEQAGVEAPYEQNALPSGLLQNVGTGLGVPDWIEEMARPSDGGSGSPVKVTMREEAIQWAVYAASFLQQNPTITDIPIIDILRDILEGVSEEDDGAYKSLTYAEAALVCTEGYGFAGGNTSLDDFYPENYLRQRRWIGLGLMQQADYWLAKFPHWTDGGDKQDMLAAPTGFKATDLASGVVCIWDPVPDAVRYRVEWGEYRPHEGAMDGSIETADLRIAISTDLPPDSFNCYFRVQAINIHNELCSSTRLAPLEIGSRLVAIPETSSSGGGGGAAPGKPTLLSATGFGGGIEITFSVADDGSTTTVIWADHDQWDDFRGGTYEYIQLTDLAPPVAGVYTASISSLATGGYWVGLRGLGPQFVPSSRSDLIRATVTAGGGGPSSGDGPIVTNFAVTPSGSRLEWLSDGNATGAYYPAWGDSVAGMGNEGWTSSLFNDYSGVPAGVRFYAVQHGGTPPSDFSIPAWSYNGSDGHIGGINLYPRPIALPALTSYDPAAGHVGARVEAANLLTPPTYWITGGEYVLPYVDPLGVNPPSPATVNGYAFDKPVRVVGSALASQFFHNCDFAANGPLAADAADYALKVESEAYVNLHECTLRYGKNTVICKGGSFFGCLFVDSGEKAIYVDLQVHSLEVLRCGLFGVGNTAAQGLEWDGVQFVLEGTATPYVPVGYAIHVESGNNGGASPGKLTQIRFSGIETYASGDPDLPGGHVVFPMESAILLETVNGPMANVDVRDSWVGSATDCLVAVDGGGSHGAPEGDVLNNIFKTGWDTSALNVAITVGNIAANRDSDGNNQ